MADWVRRAAPSEPEAEVATENIVSRLEPADLERIRIGYNIPQNVVLAVPGLNWRASCPPFGWVCLYEGHLKAGLRLPLVPFVRELLNEYQVPLAQIVPNGIRILIKFLILCGENEVEPTIDLFRFCFQLRKAAQAPGYKTFHARSNLKITTPDNNSGWRSKYLYAKIPGLDVPEEWNHAKLKDSRQTSAGPPGYEKLGALLPQDARRIGERDLVTYGLSTAVLAPLRKPTTRSTKPGWSLHMYNGVFSC